MVLEKTKYEWIKHWIDRGLTMKQSFIAFEQMLTPCPDGLDKNSNYFN